MYIESLGISCGIAQLVDVECGGYYRRDNTVQDRLEKEYREAMKDVSAAMVIASLTTEQKNEIKLLRAHGFVAVGRPRRNPNSGNQILLFVKKIRPPRPVKKVSSRSYSETQRW